MKVQLFIIVTLLGLLSTAHAQSMNINCNFVISSALYSCHLIGVSVADNENADIIIGGNHLPTRTNNDVRRVFISFPSNIPFIIRQLFTTFPNVGDFQIVNGGLTRIQSNAFADARNLRTVDITACLQFRAVHSNAFSGATGLVNLDLDVNRVETIHESAFEGLRLLQSLVLNSNQIRDLPRNIFRSLTTLRVLILSTNQLETLDGTLLSDNRQLTHLDLGWNQINAIGRNFVDNLLSLRSFDTERNICVSQHFVIAGPVTLETVRNGLATCFNNSDDLITTATPPTAPTGVPDDNTRRFILELRGPLTLRFENGTEIITI